jgi:ABC-2 type transport system ATP-binding protein
MSKNSYNGRPLAVEIHGLGKSFAGANGLVRAVHRLDLEIGVGEIVALLGPNGAGKSTTIDMLLGLTKPDAGTVTVFGRPPQEAVAAGDIGVMLQTGSLIRDLSVRELVAMAAGLYPAPGDVDEILALVGIDAIARQRTQKLSGGQTQRVRFALALVGNPRLLVLDEPTVAMDVEGRHAFWTAMRRLAEAGTTVLFATHYLDEADTYADRAVMIANGAVVADGATTEISARVGLRTIRTTLPGVVADALAALPGVVAAERHGDLAVLRCSDSDSAMRALIQAYPEAHDVEIASAGLEQAFLELTGLEAAA